jgi:hypothetical protein
LTHTGNIHILPPKLMTNMIQFADFDACMCMCLPRGCAPTARLVHGRRTLLTGSAATAGC